MKTIPETDKTAYKLAKTYLPCLRIAGVTDSLERVGPGSIRAYVQMAVGGDVVVS